jgi:hypothetical protein
MADEYTANNITMQDVASFDGTGRPVKKTRVTFYIGKFGPFMGDFDEGKNKPGDINGFIDAKAAEVRAIVARSY